MSDSITDVERENELPDNEYIKLLKDLRYSVYKYNLAKSILEKRNYTIIESGSTIRILKEI